MMISPTCLAGRVGTSKQPGSSVDAQPEGNRKRVGPLSSLNEFPSMWFTFQTSCPWESWPFVSLTDSPRRAQPPIRCLLFLQACQEPALFRKVFLYMLPRDPFCAVSAREGQGLTHGERSPLTSSEDKTAFFMLQLPQNSGANTA